MFKLFKKDRFEEKSNKEKERSFSEMENQTQNINEHQSAFNGTSSGTKAENIKDQNIDLKELQKKIINVLKTCYDPEIPVDIWELGLIYEVQLDLEKNLRIVMTLTSPMCPVAGSLPIEVEEKLKLIPGIKSVKVEIVWDPPWNYDMMSEVAKLELGFM